MNQENADVGHTNQIAARDVSSLIHDKLARATYPFNPGRKPIFLIKTCRAIILPALS
jgi:hypothetical protein